MLSSKNDAKQEARFAARLDVLMERVDTLASTVANTASAIVKKDGEIAALQRAVEARDQTLHALVDHVNRAAAGPAPDAPVDTTELRSIRNAVAALTKERASGVNLAQIESLAGTLRTIDERVQALAAKVDAPPVPTPHPATTARIEELATELEAARSELSQPQAELAETLSTLGRRVDGLASREPGVTPAQLEQRVGATHDALSRHSKRLDTVAEALEGLEQKRAGEQERLEQRLGRTDAAIDAASHRVDALAAQSHVLDALAERLAVVEGARAVDEERVDHRLGKAKEALASLAERVDALPTFDEARLDRRLTATEDALATLSQRLDSTGEALLALERARAIGDERLDGRFEQTTDTLTHLSQRVDGLRSVDEAQIERRLAETDGALAAVAQRLDALAETVDSAAANLGGKERELAALKHDFTESSTRIESVVGDIREALHAFPEQSSTTVEEIAARLERLEGSTRRANETTVRAAGELTARIESIDHRVATVAEEVSRAKTLWPVALRSLEARLDDALHAPGAEPVVADARHADPSDDLLAGLRDSLQTMESVAAEIARASDSLGEPFDRPTVEVDAEPDVAKERPELIEPDVEPPAAAAGGATIVPLRTGEP